MDHEVAARDRQLIMPGRGEATATAALAGSRWPPAWSPLYRSLLSGQLTVNSFCMPMKACGVPSAPEMKHTAP
jgi:hypothetical protein